MGERTPVVIEAALNGGRSPAEHPAIPVTPEDVATEARRCASAGATVFHVHPPPGAKEARAVFIWSQSTVRLIRDAVPGAIVSLTSLRPAGEPVHAVVALLDRLAAANALPDLISVNLGHIVAWSPGTGETGRRTDHFPNSHADIVSLFVACRRHQVTPEFGVMDLGFVSNAVALRNDGELGAWSWFLIELDSAAFGAGRQVAPSTVGAYQALVAPLREHFPDASWAAHGVDEPGFTVVRRALTDGGHVRVGFEDALCLPDGSRPRGNADLVTWAVAEARAVGREPASPAAAREIIGLAP